MTGDRRGRQLAEAIARDTYGQLVAFLGSETGDIAAAEDALSDAFAAALKHWDTHGVPRNPRGWLVGVARRRLIDHARHRIVCDALATEAQKLAVIDAMDNPDLPDRRLALRFVCAHPAIASTIRAQLMLQTVLGLSVDEIARTMLKRHRRCATPRARESQDQGGDNPSCGPDAGSTGALVVRS